MSVALSQIVQEAGELLRESRNFPHFIEPEVLLSVYLVSTQSHANPIHNLAPYFFKVHSVTFLPYSLMSFKWSLLFRFPYQNIISISHISHACYAMAYRGGVEGFKPPEIPKF